MRGDLSLCRNGKCCGVAFQDIYGGSYYPAVSLYRNITVSVNFGPDFKYPPTTHEYRGVRQAVFGLKTDTSLQFLIPFTRLYFSNINVIAQRGGKNVPVLELIKQPVTSYQTFAPIENTYIHLTNYIFPHTPVIAATNSSTT